MRYVLVYGKGDAAQPEEGVGSMTWVVSGATGFVGQHVVRALARPHHVLRCRLDDAEALDAELADVAIDGWLHLARKTVDRDGTGFDVNVRMAEQVVRRASGRIVSLSSVGVYGHAPHRDADEHTPLAPDTPLARSQAAADALLLEAGAVVVRPRFVLGEGDRDVVPRILPAVRKSPVWLDGGRPQLSWVAVDDLANVFVRAHDLSAGVYHVTASAVTFRELATALLDRFGGTAPRASLPAAWLVRALRLRERVLGLDPETTTSSFTSIRVQLAATDQSFSGAKLAAAMPMDFRTLSQTLEASAQWYASQPDRRS
jgi:nucleoside-diphosphate-sugar epimerase